MSRDSILDDAIAKAEADGDVQLVEWLRATRGAGRAMRRYSAKLKELEDFARRIEACAERREPVTLFGVDYVADGHDFEYGSPEHIAGLSRVALEKDFVYIVSRNKELERICERLDDENARLRELVRDMWSNGAFEPGACYAAEADVLKRRTRELGIEVD